MATLTKNKIASLLLFFPEFKSLLLLLVRVCFIWSVLFPQNYIWRRVCTAKYILLYLKAEYTTSYISIIATAITTCFLFHCLSLLGFTFKRLLFHFFVYIFIFFSCFFFVHSLDIRRFCWFLKSLWNFAIMASC